MRIASESSIPKKARGGCIKPVSPPVRRSTAERIELVKSVLDGHTLAAVGEKFGISMSSVKQAVLRTVRQIYAVYDKELNDQSITAIRSDRDFLHPKVGPAIEKTLRYPTAEQPSLKTRVKELPLSHSAIAHARRSGIHALEELSWQSEYQFWNAGGSRRSKIVGQEIIALFKEMGGGSLNLPLLMNS